MVKSDFAGHRIFSGEYPLAVCIWHSKPNALFGQCRPGICQRPIGVIDNYYRQGLDHPIVPEFYLLEPEPATTVLVNVPTGQMANVQKQLKVIWSRLFNEQKEEFYQVEQMIQSEYHQHRVLMGITLMAGFIMLILSLCGLGCLQLYLLHCRRKELAIRQVMGATFTDTVKLLGLEFVRLLMFSTVLAIPASHWLLENWLSGYPLRVDNSVLWYVLSPTTLHHLCLV